MTIRANIIAFFSPPPPMTLEDEKMALRREFRRFFRRFFRKAFYCFLFCALAVAVWNLWPRPIVAGQLFSLQASYIGWLFNTVCIFLIVQVGSTVYGFLSSQMPVRPVLRFLTKVVLAWPIIGFGIVYQFQFFDQIVVQDDFIELRGASFLATQKFKIKHVELVYQRSNSYSTDLNFMWYGEVFQSVKIASFDAESNENLKQLIAEFGKHGIKVLKERPDPWPLLKRFRPMK